MCESETVKTKGWKGWLDLPQAKISSATGGWLDLSHPLTETLSRFPLFPQPSIKRVVNWPPANVTAISMVVHHGTHLDAPVHFINDGPTMDQVPLDRFYGPGVVWPLDVAPKSEITVAHLEKATPRMKPGDIVLLDTGTAKRINTAPYHDNPYLGAEASEWLVKQGAKIVGIDATSPDKAPHLRPPDYPNPAHNILLGHGVLIGEHLTNLTSLAGKRAEIMFMALNIVGSDGAPARVMARPAD